MPPKWVSAMFCALALWLAVSQGIVASAISRGSLAQAQEAKAQERLSDAHELVARTKPPKTLSASWPSGYLTMSLACPRDPEHSSEQWAEDVLNELSVQLSKFPPKEK